MVGMGAIEQRTWSRQEQDRLNRTSCRQGMCGSKLHGAHSLSQILRHSITIDDIEWRWALQNSQVHRKALSKIADFSCVFQDVDAPHSLQVLGLEVAANFALQLAW